jgi:hypothetical protein
MNLKKCVSLKVNQQLEPNQQTGRLNNICFIYDLDHQANIVHSIIKQQQPRCHYDCHHSDASSSSFFYETKRLELTATPSSTQRQLAPADDATASTTTQRSPTHAQVDE